MARCRWCDRRGFFLPVDTNGLCRNCQPHIIEIESRSRVLNESMHLAREGKTFATRLSRCDLVLEHAEFLATFEKKGVPTVSPGPSTIVLEFRQLRELLILDEASSASKKAFDKASVASTPKAKERALAAGVLKVREVAQSLDDQTITNPIEERLRKEIHRVTLDGYLEAARKAEFKGNVKKAIDQYQEALYFIRNDDIDDSQQRSEIREIEDKLAELNSQ